VQVLTTFDFTADGVLPFYWEPCNWYQLTYNQASAWKLQSYFSSAKYNKLYGHVKFSGFPSPLLFGLSVITDHVMPVLHVCHKVRRWPNKRAWEQILDIWPILLEFGPLNDLLLFVTGHRWCRSPAKVTKRMKIEKSKLFFVIPKTISVIPYPYNFLVSYPLSLKLFCQLSLIPKTPNRASLLMNDTDPRESPW